MDQHREYHSREHKLELTEGHLSVFGLNGMLVESLSLSNRVIQLAQKGKMIHLDLLDFNPTEALVVKISNEDMVEILTESNGAVAIRICGPNGPVPHVLHRWSLLDWEVKFWCSDGGIFAGPLRRKE